MRFPAIVMALLCFSSTDEAPSKYRVAVIGGGIGGTATALFLREELGEEVDIVVYEKDRIGGRLATVEMGGRHYESGGSIIHPRNRYMANLTNSLGLKVAQDFPIPMTLGLYDGQDLVFRTHRYPLFSSMINKIRFFWRYGFDLLNLDPWIEGLLKWYDGIYPAQTEKTAFSSVHEMFHSLSAIFDDMVASSSGSYLSQLGFGNKFNHELARIAMRTNYGRDLEIHAFVGAISLAGTQAGAWSVEGGNYQVAEAALKESRARLVRNEVTGVTESKASSEHRFVVSSVDSSGESVDEAFDAVVLAVPCTRAGCSGILFEVKGMKEKMDNFPKSYHRTVANFVKGELDPEFFGLSSHDDIPDSLYSVADETLIFQSISRKVPVDYGSNPDDPKTPSELDVYKIFTSKPLTVHHVKRMFKSHSEFVVVDWMAYPNYDHLYKNAEASLPSFVMDMGGALISVNAIETAASAMEQSVLAAKNAALLVRKYLQGNLSIAN